MFLGLKPWVAHPASMVVNRAKDSHIITRHPVLNNPFRFIKIKILTEIIFFTNTLFKVLKLGLRRLQITHETLEKHEIFVTSAAFSTSQLLILYSFNFL